MTFLRKNIMAATGLFLCFFLIIHLGGNLILLLPAEVSHSLYNRYSHTLGENLLIKLVSLLLYFSIILHSLVALKITIENKKARGESYSVKDNAEVTSWTSQNMGLLGFFILFFIIIHMANLWARVKLGLGDFVELDSSGLKDIYQITHTLFQNPLYVTFYSLSMIPLALHLRHGVISAFRTLGLYHKRYIRFIDKVSKIYSAVIFVGFAIIPIVVYFRG